MGLHWSAEAKELQLRSDQIDEQIKEDKIKSEKEIKLLLIGFNKSEKSTITKYMKLMQDDYSWEEELSLCQIAVYENLIHSVQAIVYAIKKFQLEPKKTINKNDLIISEVLAKKHHFYLMDSAPYFLDAVRRIELRNYVPNEDNILRSQIKKSVSEISINIGQYNILMLDVDKTLYQRKFLHYFEFVTSIVFCVALDEYDQDELEPTDEESSIIRINSL
ncbi:36601_t:CDS:2 [Racocetra persica]|uniref:36601_t:CDS:1 n=1 Tax=Racocetra persica TaxID=160502 RepID=A0ACA9KNM5_9GLOM|nr:36601_t:CDS:2 [Racocetra persica]